MPHFPFVQRNPRDFAFPVYHWANGEHKNKDPMSLNTKGWHPFLAQAAGKQTAVDPADIHQRLI